MLELTSYLRFHKQCREAMTFYQECIGGELTLQTVGESPAAANMPPETQDSVMHSAIKMNDRFVLFASDMMDSNTAVQGNTMSVTLTGTVDEMKAAWEKLSVGAKIGQELKEEFFGTYGDLTDKFGVGWMFQANPAPQQ